MIYNALQNASEGVAPLFRQGSARLPTSQNSVDTAKASLATAAINYDDNLVKFSTQVLSAQTSIDTSNNSVETARIGYSQTQTRLKTAALTAQTTIDNAQIAITTAQASFEKTKAADLTQIATAQGQVDSAQASYATAQATYNKAVLPPLQTDIITAKAGVDSAKALLDQAQNALEDLTLKAPTAGTISTITGVVGQVAPTTTFITMTDLNALKFTASVNEADIAKLRIGMGATFTVDAYPNQRFSATVATIAPQGTTTQNVVSYEVVGAVQQTANVALLPGMTATVNIVLEEAPNTLVVPNTAFSTAQSIVVL